MTTDTQLTGADLIAAERERQVSEEGWSSEHDDAHTDGSLVQAAVAYAEQGRNDWPPRRWPWAPSWWRPTADPVKALVKAGALIAAEIDRLQRAAR